MQPAADCLRFLNEFVWFNAIRSFWDSQSRFRQMDHPVATGASGCNRNPLATGTFRLDPYSGKQLPCDSNQTPAENE